MQRFRGVRISEQGYTENQATTRKVLTEVSDMSYQGLVWAGVYVQDLDAAIAYYRDVLSLPFLDRGEDWAHFDSGAGTLLELFTGGTSRQAPKKPDEQSIILGLRVDNLDSAVRELTDRGVRILPGGSGEFAGTRWAHFTDLEGNRLEVKELNT
jgi:predicted enzyme related to lactoylglutathione lyase